jgi:cell division protein ZipA
VINAMAPEGKPFKGNDLLQILMACDVRYGKMNIFHRYENSDGTGEIQFSVANLVEPGNFDLDEIDEFTTPGVVFFMHLPGPKESIKAYEAMVETARCLVKNLEGELRDQTHSVATKQTLEHYKQRIRDFERRQLTLM